MPLEMGRIDWVCARCRTQTSRLSNRQRRFLSNTAPRTGPGQAAASFQDLSKTRNIGIIAHIDAVSIMSVCCVDESILKFQGKTTTTERMLFYSGHTSRIGSMFSSLIMNSIEKILTTLEFCIYLFTKTHQISSKQEVLRLRSY